MLFATAKLKNIYKITKTSQIISACLNLFYDKNVIFYDSILLNMWTGIFLNIEMRKDTVFKFYKHKANLCLRNEAKTKWYYNSKIQASENKVLFTVNIYKNIAKELL